MKDLENRILEIVGFSDVALRWSEIRNQLLVDGFSDTHFGVKVQRILARLCAQGLIERHDRGHMKIFYSLSEDAEEKLLAEQGPVIMKIAFLGVYKPGDSFEKFRAKLRRRLERAFPPRPLWEGLDQRYGKKEGGELDSESYRK